MHDEDRLRRLIARVGEFHITDRAMKNAQKKAEAAFAGATLPDSVRDEYLAAVRRYFNAFSKEAYAQLRDVDKRLERANQVHFNLTAERGVVVKRIEATQSVLKDLDVVAGSGRN